jgi:hypothetical protein
LRLGFRRNFLLCISSLISSQGLSKVFWKFKIWHRCIPMHILAWTDCVKVQVSFDIRTRVYFRVSLHLTNDIKPWNKNQRKRIKRDRATGIIQKLLSYVNCREIYFSYTWQTNTLTNKMEMMLRDKQIPSPTRWKWYYVTNKYPRQQDGNDATWQTNTLANKMEMMLRFTDSDYPFCIFKLFLEIDYNGNKRHRITWKDSRR